MTNEERKKELEDALSSVEEGIKAHLEALLDVNSADSLLEIAMALGKVVAMKKSFEAALELFKDE